MARVQVDYQSNPVGLQTVSAPRISAVQARNDPRGSSGFALAEALGAAQPILEDFNKKYQQDKLQEQALKIDAYKAQFLQDHQGGAVSQAQVRERFPETVPIIAARIAESIGMEQGKKATQGIIEEIMGNDALRLDSTARNAFITKKRAEMFGSVGEGNDFYLNGFTKSIDAELNQYENRWQQDTANYHQEVQAQTFKQEVVGALMNNGDLMAVDSKWKGSSSLNNIERNKLVIDAVTEQAFVADDPSLLDKIPVRFLNAESRAAIEKSKAQIQAARMTKIRDAKALADWKRDEQLRTSKIDMLNGMVNGQPPDPAQYANNPDAFEFALRIQSAELVNPVQSKATASALREEFLTSATIDSSVSPQTMRDRILSAPGINAADKVALLNEVPQLADGLIALNDPAIRRIFTDRLNPRLTALENSPNAQIQGLLNGRNLRSEVLKTYDAEIRAGFLAYYEDNKRYPTGKAKQDIIDQATERAEKQLQELTSIKNLNTNAAPAAPAPAAPATANPQAPTANQLPTVSTEAQYNALPAGARFVDPQGKIRQKPKPEEKP